jgi:hypothetical protein
MTPGQATMDLQTPPAGPSEKQGPPLKVLVFSPTLDPAHRIPPPVEFANALAAEGVSVWFAAAIGPLRTGLGRAIGYFMIDDANSAPVKTAHELMKLLRHHRPDVVHAHGARCAILSALAIKASHVKCARVMTHLVRLRKLPVAIKGPVVKHCADRYFAATSQLKAELEALGVPEDRIVLEPAGETTATQFARDSIAVYRDLLGHRDGTD